MTSFIAQAWRFIRLSRLIFLLGGILSYALGAAIAIRLGADFDAYGYVIGQAAVTSIQLMAHYMNEYADIQVDSLLDKNHRTWFSGGSGLSGDQGVSAKTILLAARICSLFAMIFGVLASIQSPWMIPIIGLSFLGSWFYSAKPVALMSTGWGELTTSIISALFVPLSGYILQDAFPPIIFWLIILPLVPVHMAMLIAFEIPDYTADRMVEKRTLAVRLGLINTARLISGLLIVSFLVIAIAGLVSEYTGRWMIFALPLAGWQIYITVRVIQSPTKVRYHLLTTVGVGTYILMQMIALLVK